MYAPLDFRFVIFRTHLRQFPEELARPLILYLRRLNNDFDDFIPSPVLSRIHHTLLPETKLLAILSPLRHFQQGPSINGRNFDLSA